MKCHLTVANYQEALDVQDACNLSGVAHLLTRVLGKLEGGTSERNQHPIVRLLVYKMYLLAFPEEELPDGFHSAYVDVTDVIVGKCDPVTLEITEEFAKATE